MTERLHNLDITILLRYIKNEMKKKTIYQYPVFIEPCDEGGFFATCPALPGCHVQGEKLEDTLNEMKAVIDAYLEDLKSHHESIPKPTQFTITSIGVAV
jgi:predicted RNase H-like HicB family nuclease